MRDVKALADSMFVAVKGYLSTALTPVVARMTALETALAKIPHGPQGDRGEKGDPGADGKNGADGLTVKGDPGERGLDGLNGIDGKDGAPGIDGKDGANGKDGEKGERGEAGEKGDPGEQGPIGPPGPAGPRGEDGHHGKDGSNGLDGKSGADGKDGRDGRDGKDGANGRDALEIDILPAIDETRSYPRGTFASHRGGIVRAVRNTDHLAGDLIAAGWSVIVEGLASLVVLQGEDHRTFTVRSERTSGRANEAVFSMPAMIYRQVYVAGKDYAVGDTVTWDGSLWVCETPTKGQPKLSPDWRLCAKRGSDGKAGKDGKHGERGAEGPRGRDMTQLGLDGKKW